MPRPTHLLVLTLLACTLLTPAIATARPAREDTARQSAERHQTAPGLLAQARDRLSCLWAEIGSALDPNGTGTTSSGAAGDIGSGLDPDGRP